MNFFESVEQSPPDPIFGLLKTFRADAREQKVNLVAGVYQTSELKPLILNCVKQAEHELVSTETSKNYLAIDGIPEYVELTKQLCFDSSEKCIYGAQTVGGTAALRVGARFLKEHGFSKVYLSNPTWANHRRIFQHAGLEVNSYPYFDWKTRRFDFDSVVDAFSQMEEGSCVLLHACCHNPTGGDPTLGQWETLCELMKEKRLFPFFDFAYQGFDKDPEHDAASIRLFLNQGLQFAVAISHSKNFGLYAERCGALYFVCDTEDEAQKVGSCIKVLIRGMYSNPACHGARIVTALLKDPELKQNWLRELSGMRERIKSMRIALLAELSVQGFAEEFEFLALQNGMFSYTGLERAQVDRLISEYGIYLPKDGRINISGLNTENTQYVAEAIIAVSELKS